MNTERKRKEKKKMKIFKAKRKLAENYTAEYIIKAESKEEAERKIFKMTGERLKVTEK